MCAEKSALYKHIFWYINVLKVVYLQEYLIFKQLIIIIIIICSNSLELTRWNPLEMLHYFCTFQRFKRTKATILKTRASV